MWGTVGRLHAPERRVFALSAALAGMLLAGPMCALGLDPSLDISQYAHTAWKIRDGFPKGQITSIAQTPDGYLWLGTEFGLVRFDGVKAVPWQPPPEKSLPSNFILSLLVAHDGTLWIGTYKGLASWKDGKLTHYPELNGQYVFKILEDREGSIWASGVALPNGKLCAISNGRIQCHGEDGSLGRGSFNLYEDSKDNLWVGVKDGVWHWKPDPPKYFSLPGELNGIQGLGEDVDGALLVGWRGGIRRLVNGKTESYPLAKTVPQFAARRLLRDRDGGLWIGATDRGLVHVHQGKTDVFAPSDGLTGEDVYTFFEDREGNIWVSTPNGLDRFRQFVAATISEKQALANATVGAILADRDGSIWLSTYGGLFQWKNGQIMVPRTGPNKPDGRLNGQNPNSMFQDDRGRIWIGATRQFGYLENHRFVPVSGVPGGPVTSIAQDTAGNLWIANEGVGLLELFQGKLIQSIPWAKLGHTDHVSAMIADPSRGGLWLGFHYGGLIYFRDDRIRESYTAANGLGAERVEQLRFDNEGTLWAATDNGLSRVKNGHVGTLTSKNGLPCDAVHWSIEDDVHSVWLYTSCGLVRVARSDLDAWAAAVDQGKDVKPMIQSIVFDTSDGVRIVASAGHYSAQVVKTRDGRVWFLPGDGVSVIDPQHLPFNKLPPPVHVEQIIADRKTYDVASDANGQVRIPPRVRDLEINYTALSLVAPERVLFRYKLEGWDPDWQDAVTRRQAFYTNLPPGNYRFRVMACNNSGVWNEAVSSLDFFVAPAYYQTWWFRSLCAIALLGLLATAYRMRKRQLARKFNIRLEARVGERTRIARDLHDTLLQSFQGVLLKFHAVTFTVVDRPAEAQQTLKSVIEQARQAITEGRDAVQGLRAPALVGIDIAQALGVLGRDLAAGRDVVQRPDFHVQVEGTPRELSPLLRDDIYRIVSEALRNAFEHSQAQRIEVEIRYDQRQLRMRVRDNGKGIDPKVLEAGGRVGHYGLPGMHERAKLIGAKMTVWSELESGTEAELTIPAAIIYTKSQAARRAMFWKNGNQP